MSPQLQALPSDDAADLAANRIPYLRDMYARGNFRGPDGDTVTVHSTTDAVLVSILYNMIVANKFERTLEVGLAFGASTEAMCAAHTATSVSGANHVAIDRTNRHSGTDWAGGT